MTEVLQKNLDSSINSDDDSVTSCESEEDEEFELLQERALERRKRVEVQKRANQAATEAARARGMGCVPSCFKESRAGCTPLHKVHKINTVRGQTLADYSSEK